MTKDEHFPQIWISIGDIKLLRALSESILKNTEQKLLQTKYFIAKYFVPKTEQ